ncbi:MAG: rhodanese-like domain-containing protein [Promethearchaeota archaeon]
MKLSRIRSEGLAHISYFLTSENEACVIDPRRDAGIYLEKAWKSETNIKYIFETHRNEDYVIGSCEIADIIDVEIYHGPGLEWKYGNTLVDGQEFTVGLLKIKALHTPGHTDESCSFIVIDTITGDEPVFVFTGDALFVGDTGRIDMYGPEKAKKNAKNLFNSLFKNLLPLGDHVIILPAHGSGSVCGADISEREQSTLGLERLQNKALQLTDKEKFIEFKLNEHHYFSPYFKKMEELNLMGPPLLRKVPRFKPLLANKFKQMVENNGFIIDTRNPAAFNAAHIKGSYNIWLKGLPSYGGWVIPYDKPLFLVVNNFIELNKAHHYLLRLGYDNIEGYLVGGIIAWYSNNFPIETTGMLSARQLKNRLDEGKDTYILDVRGKTELKKGMIKGAHHIYVGELEQRINELPKDKSIVTVCGNGARASMASSILKRNGFSNISNILGSMEAWYKGSYPIEN